MADQLPVNFQIPGEPVISSYPYDDVADATGYVLFYPTGSTDDGGIDYLLSTTPLYGRPYLKLIQGTAGAGPWAETLTFESTSFNAPRILKGRMLFDFFWKLNGTGAAGTVWLGTIDIKLYHYDGSTETQLGSTWTSANAVSTPLVNDAEVLETGYIDITTLQKFKVGDQIRIKITLNLSETGGSGTCDLTFYYDPMNRTAPAASTQTFRALVPFKIEV